MAQTYTRTYTWKQNSNVSEITVYTAHGSSWTWGSQSINAHYIGIATKSGIGEQWGSYCTIDGDTAHYATKITSITCSCWFDHPNTPGSWVYYYVLGNNGTQLVAISTDNNTWVKDEEYARTKNNLELSGDFLNNGIYGILVRCSAPEQQISLKKGDFKLSVTFEGAGGIKCYDPNGSNSDNTGWSNCSAKYWNGTGWVDVMPNRWNGSSWERV